MITPETSARLRKLKDTLEQRDGMDVLVDRSKGTIRFAVRAHTRNRVVEPKIKGSDAGSFWAVDPEFVRTELKGVLDMVKRDLNSRYPKKASYSMARGNPVLPMTGDVRPNYYSAVLRIRQEEPLFAFIGLLKEHGYSVIESTAKKKKR